MFCFSFLQSQFIEHIIVLSFLFMFPHMIHKHLVVWIDYHKELRCVSSIGAELAFKKFQFEMSVDNRCQLGVKCEWLVIVSVILC